MSSLIHCYSLFFFNQLWVKVSLHQFVSSVYASQELQWKCFRETLNDSLEDVSLYSLLDDLYKSVWIQSHLFCCFTLIWLQWSLSDLRAGGQHYESHYKSSKNSNKEGAGEAQMLKHGARNTESDSHFLQGFLQSFSC